ncbi:MAG TPA: acyltransferase [Opitutaceae bacterium]|nr:acyltransferase [Opitutaceae bacterium]
MSRGESHTNTDIEVLRAIAVSFTLIAHLVWGIVPKLGTIGREVYPAFAFWTGVDLFFAISGFVITASLLRLRTQHLELAGPEGRRDLADFIRFARPFWIRRVFRLLPSAWLWIGITLLLAGFYNAHDSFGALRFNLHEAVAAVFDVANFYYYSWFAHGHSAYGSLGVYWSLSLEEQFYLLFPLILFFLRPRAMIGGLIVLFLAQFFVPRPDGFDPHQASLLWFIRTDAVILGVLIATWQSHPSYRTVEPRFLRRRIPALAALGAGVALLAAVPAFSPDPIATGIVALISGGLVLIASYDRHYILPPARLKSALVWLGSRSYSIYLIHVAGRAAILETKRRYEIAGGSAAAALWSVLSVVLILLIAELNFRLVETPFRNLGRRLAERYRRRPDDVVRTPVRVGD